MSCPLEKFARVVGKCPVCLAEHEAGPSSLPGLIADWAEDDRPAPPDGVVSLPAPKPDELTVDDVLGVADAQFTDGTLRIVDGVWVTKGRVAYILEDYRIGRRPAEKCVGTLREVLTEAKRRGMLG